MLLLLLGTYTLNLICCYSNKLPTWNARIWPPWIWRSHILFRAHLYLCCMNGSRCWIKIWYKLSKFKLKKQVWRVTLNMCGKWCHWILFSLGQTDRKVTTNRNYRIMSPLLISYMSSDADDLLVTKTSQNKTQFNNLLISIFWFLLRRARGRRGMRNASIMVLQIPCKYLNFELSNRFWLLLTWGELR